MMFHTGRHGFMAVRISQLIRTGRFLTIQASNTSNKEEICSSPIRGAIKAPEHCSIFQPYGVVVVGGGHAGCEGEPDK